MAKFCGQCGAQMDDTDRVCGNCGTPLGDVGSNASSRNISGGRYVDPAQEAINKKRIKLGLGMVAVVVIAVIAINIISSYTGCNGVVRKVMAAYEDYDISTLVDMASDVHSYGADDFGERYFTSKVGSDLDTYEEMIGHNYSMSYKINETYTPSDRNIEKITADISSQYKDFDIDIIEELAVAELTVSVEQDDKTRDRDLEITLSKENGDWRLLYLK